MTKQPTAMKNQNQRTPHVHLQRSIFIIGLSDVFSTFSSGSHGDAFIKVKS